MRVCKIKLIREKYRIPRSALARVCGMSEQRLCQLELDGVPIRPTMAKRLCFGLEKIMWLRVTNASELAADIEKHRDTLTEYVEETTYEL